MAHAKLKHSLQMKTMFTAETSLQGRRSGTNQIPDPMSNITAGNPLEKSGMNLPDGPVDRTKIGLGIVLLAALTGCVGYVDGGYVGGGYVGAVVVPEPLFIGGVYERGRDVHVYSQRGVASRAVAHPPGGGARGGARGGKR